MMKHSNPSKVSITVAVLAAIVHIYTQTTLQFCAVVGMRAYFVCCRPFNFDFLQFCGVALCYDITLLGRRFFKVAATKKQAGNFHALLSCLIYIFCKK